jgi:hypothetical protein
MRVGTGQINHEARNGALDIANQKELSKIKALCTLHVAFELPSAKKKLVGKKRGN